MSRLRQKEGMTHDPKHTGAMAMSDATRQRIEEGLRNWDQPESEARKRFQAAQEKLNDVVKALEKAISASERLTEEDYVIRINARG